MENNTIDLQDFCQRLGNLENQNRRLRIALLAAALGVGVLLLMGAAKRTPVVVTANGFVLRDANGRVRARLNVMGGEPSLKMYDTGGSARVSMGITTTLVGTGPALRLYDSHGGERAILWVAQGDPELTLLDASGGPRVDLTFSGGEPILNLDDPNDKHRLTLAVVGGVPSISLSDHQGYKTDIGGDRLLTPTTGEIAHTSAASITMSGRDGKLIWRAP